MKDITFVEAIHHFDKKIIQYQYDQYTKGLNLLYIFVGSIFLVCFSHVVTGLYWRLNNNKPMMFGRLNSFERAMCYVPLTIQPILFTMLVAQRIQLETIKAKGFSQQNWNAYENTFAQEAIIEETMVDIKIIEIVTDAFPQIVILGVLLLRLKPVIAQNYDICPR